jgi:hypothetical protein
MEGKERQKERQCELVSSPSCHPPMNALWQWLVLAWHYGRNMIKTKKPCFIFIWTAYRTRKGLIRSADHILCTLIQSTNPWLFSGSSVCLQNIETHLHWKFWNCVCGRTTGNTTCKCQYNVTWY